MAKFTLTVEVSEGIATIKGDADFDPGDNMTAEQQACMVYVQGVIVAINTIREHTEEKSEDLEDEVDPSNPEFH